MTFDLPMYNTPMQYVVGVDEAGRGALAGPVCVGAVLMPIDFKWEDAFQLIAGRGDVRIRDSKQISAQQRDILYDFITLNRDLRSMAALVPASRIDEVGIVAATNEAAAQAIGGLNANPANTVVLLDAGLRIPDVWQQESHVRGDEQFPAIALASMIAKVTRDRHMEGVALIQPGYGFEVHKGYGTVVHRRAIKEKGPSPVHRKTFLRS